MSDQHIPNGKCGCSTCHRAWMDIQESVERVKDYEREIRPLMLASNPLRRTF